MPEKLIFEKIFKGDIFCDSFNDMTSKNEIEFSGDGISVLYGPNGVGKTSLANVLGCEIDCAFQVKRDGKTITHSSFAHEI